MEFKTKEALRDHIRQTGAKGDLHVLTSSKRVNPDTFSAALRAILPSDQIGLTVRPDAVEIAIADSVTDEQLTAIETALANHDPNALPPAPNFAGMTPGQTDEWLDNNVGDSNVRAFLKYLAGKQGNR